MQRPVSDAEYIRWLENDRHNKDAEIAALKAENMALTNQRDYYQGHYLYESGEKVHFQVKANKLEARAESLEAKVEKAMQWFDEVIAGCDNMIRESNVAAKIAALRYIKSTAEEGKKQILGEK